MFLHKHFNFSGSVNTRRNVSLHIALIAFWAYKKDPKSRLNVFCLPVDPLSFRHNFDSCDALSNTILTQTTSLCKLRYGMVRQNST